MLELHEGDLVADRFRIEAIIGEGGIARVYRVRHVRLGSVHALKYLTLQRPALADRLLLEGRIQAQLQHPNLVRVTDVVEHGGQPCLVMELIKGSNLQILLDERGAIPIDEALRLFAGVLSAVATAHDVGVLHRDLKPANILLARRGDRWIPKVSDFGIAKVATEGLREGETRAGVQMGTPGYMAPEQIEDSAQVDHRADIFALGAILYEMLSGHRPFGGDTAFRTLRSTIEGRLDPIRALVRDCPPEIARAIERCLEGEMLDRYTDCHALADALFEGRPELRGLVRRIEADAVPEGLHRPELRTVPTSGAAGSGATGSGATGSGATGSTRPGLHEPTSGATLAPQDELLAAIDVAPAPQPTPTPDPQPAPTPAPTPDPTPSHSLLGGIRPDNGDRAGPSLGAAVAPVGDDGPAFSDLDAAATPAGGAGGDADSWVDDDTPTKKGSPLPWLLGAAALLLTVGAGWMLTQGGDASQAQALIVPDEKLGEAVTLPQDDAGATTPRAPSAETTAAAASAETPPADAAAAQAAPAPTETAPAEASPAEASPTAAASAETAPAETTPAETTPAETTPAEVTPTSAELPAELTPEEPPAAETAVAETPAEETPAQETPAQETPTEETPAEETPAEETPPAENTATGDAVADAATDGPPAEATPAPETAPAAPALTGTWSGTANDKPLTLRIFSQDGTKVSGEVRFTQGANQRVWTVSGSFDAASNRLSLVEKSGSVTFTALVRGSGMMGTYGRSGKDEALSWSATRQ